MHVLSMESNVHQTLSKMKMNAQTRAAYVVHEHMDQIKELLNLGVSIAAIANELTNCGLSIHPQTLSKYIKKTNKTGVKGDDAKEAFLKNLPKQTTGSQPILVKPKTVQEHLQHQIIVQQEAKKILATQPNVPPEVEKFKFFNFSGETFDATKIKIEEHMKVSRDYATGEKVPYDISKQIRKENLFKGLYEQALKDYGIAIVNWQSKLKEQT